MNSIEHKDILGNIITENSKLAVAYRNSLLICSIVKITPKMIRVKMLKSTNDSDFLISPSQAIVVDGPDLVAFILK